MMSTVTMDVVFLIFIGLLAILGFFRGILSQVMAIAGLIAAYLFSNDMSVFVVKRVAQVMGTSEAIARPIAVIWAGLLIYIGCRLVGYGIEKLLVNQVGALKGINRIGGFLFGALKGCFFLFIIFKILTMIPQEALERRAPKLFQSRMYSFFTQSSLFDVKNLENIGDKIGSTIGSSTAIQEKLKNLGEKYQSPTTVIQNKIKDVTLKEVNKINTSLDDQDKVGQQIIKGDTKNIINSLDALEKKQKANKP